MRLCIHKREEEKIRLAASFPLVLIFNINVLFHSFFFFFFHSLPCNVYCFAPSFDATIPSPPRIHIFRILVLASSLSSISCERNIRHRRKVLRCRCKIGAKKKKKKTKTKTKRNSMESCAELSQR